MRGVECCVELVICVLEIADTRSQPPKKSTWQIREPEHFGHFMFKLTYFLVI